MMDVTKWGAKRVLSLWLGIALASVVAGVALGSIALERLDEQRMQLNVGAESPSSLAGLVLILGLIAWGLVVTLRWFRARREPPSED